MSVVVGSKTAASTPNLSYGIVTRTGVAYGGNGSWTTLGLTLTTPNTLGSLWLLFGTLYWTSSSSASGFSILDFVWATADGANSASQPTAITPTAGLAGPMGGIGGSVGDDAVRMLKPTEIVLGPNVTVFLVPYNSDLIANTGTISGQITYHRVK